MAEVTSEEMYGIAKKFNKDMEALPMHTHSAIVELIRVGMQHRILAMQKADKDRNDALQERAVEVQEQQIALAREESDRRNAAILAQQPAGSMVAQ